MTSRSPYTYSALRYVHDLTTGEFVNVGIVVYCPARRFLGAKFRHTHRRLSAIFPDIDAAAFRMSMRNIERALNATATRYSSADLFPLKGDAIAVARSVLPADDSSLQWSNVGSGIASSPEHELERLYDRLVARYDEHSDRRRSDDDVWRPVREKLEKAHVATKLREKTIRGAADELAFKHAWKNGVWHCYEAVSFDLADADGIKNKARRWAGHLSGVRDVSKTFKPYFIVGAPSEARLKGAYNDALAILENSPVQVEIFKEKEADRLVAKIETELKSHD